MTESLIYHSLIDKYHYKLLTSDQLVIFRYILRKCPKLIEEFMFYQINIEKWDENRGWLIKSSEEAYRRVIKEEEED